LLADTLYSLPFDERQKSYALPVSSMSSICHNHVIHGMVIHRMVMDDYSRNGYLPPVEVTMLSQCLAHGYIMPVLKTHVLNTHNGSTCIGYLAIYVLVIQP
jgi:hypothetical protein